MRQQPLIDGFEKHRQKTRKGNQWYFGMKAHIGVDSQNRLIHSVAATPANVHNSAYAGQTHRIKQLYFYFDHL